MIKRTRYSVEALPFIPEGAEFRINGKYAIIGRDDILFLYDHYSKDWISTDLTLDQYSTYWDKILDEYTLHEFIQRVWGSSYVGKNMYGSLDDIFIFNDVLSASQVTELMNLQPCCN